MNNEFMPGLFVGIILSASFVFSFGDETSYYHEYLIAIETCKNNAGYEEINTHMLVKKTEITCSDGAVFTIWAGENDN